MQNKPLQICVMSVNCVVIYVLLTSQTIGKVTQSVGFTCNYLHIHEFYNKIGNYIVNYVVLSWIMDSPKQGKNYSLKPKTIPCFMLSKQGKQNFPFYAGEFKILNHEK